MYKALVFNVTKEITDERESVVAVVVMAVLVYVA